MMRFRRLVLIGGSVSPEANMEHVKTYTVFLSRSIIVYIHDGSTVKNYTELTFFYCFVALKLL